MQAPNVETLVQALTLEEKAQLCTGKDFWFLHGVERLGLPSIMVTDGPHGLRKQSGAGDHVGLNASVPATCFPTASATAASWNPELIEEMGRALGAECRAQDVSVLLGPGTNLKRNPLGGRNFEYFSEDPMMGGDFSTAWIKGVQSQDVGTSLKHYAVNNHELGRMTVDAVIDQRTLREMYLPAFEQAVKNAQPWTVMNSYNKVNGTYAAEHKQLLHDILVEEWGFEGIVVTDWGANNDRVAGLKAGQTLEMPSSGDMNTKKILAAIDAGDLSVEQLDYAVTRLLQLIVKSKAALEAPKVAVDLEQHHVLARQIAQESCVLLKNDQQLLPVTTAAKVAVIGALATNTRYQGAGSSKINPFKLEQPLEEIEKRYGKENVQFAPGYHLDDTPDAQALDAAFNVAADADVVFVFAGLTPKYESEGFDRKHLNLPQVQLDLIEALKPLHSKVVVILQNGAPVVMPFLESVGAVLEAYLGGQAGASAVASILSGDINPSGKLAETFPLSLDDVPSTPYFPGNGRQVQYREGIWVGYRYFDSVKKPVLFPFGHGLSYTSFSYSDLVIDAEQPLTATNTHSLSVGVTVTNTGDRDGAEVVQLYLGQQAPSVPRPEKALRAYKKVFLKAGESQHLNFTLDYRAFAFWDVSKNDWVAESDWYTLYVGASVADIRLQADIELETDTRKMPRNSALQAYFKPEQRSFSDAAFRALLGHDIPEQEPITPYHLNSTLGDIRATKEGAIAFDKVFKVFSAMMAGDENSSAAEADHLMAVAMVEDMPLRNLAVFNREQFSEQDVLDMIDRLNA